MIRLTTALALVALLATTAGAQHILVGNFNAWSPAQAPNTMLDDGVAPDAAAADGIFTLTVSDAGGLAGDRRGIKATGPGGWTDNEIPSGGNNHDYLLTGLPASPQAVTVFIDTNSQADGWMPDANIISTDSPQTFSTVTAVGDFQDNIPGGGGDWNNSDANTLMDDTGTDANDTASDDIYTLTVLVSPPGNYEWKGIYDNEWGREFGAVGFATGGPNLTFTTSVSPEFVILEINTVTGRSRATATGTVPVELSLFSAN